MKGLRRKAEGYLGIVPAEIRPPLFQSKLLPDTKTDVLVQFLFLDFLKKKKKKEHSGAKGQETEVRELAWPLTSHVISGKP